MNLVYKSLHESKQSHFKVMKTILLITKYLQPILCTESVLLHLHLGSVSKNLIVRDILREKKEGKEGGFVISLVIEWAYETSIQTASLCFRNRHRNNGHIVQLFPLVRDRIDVIFDVIENA